MKSMKVIVSAVGKKSNQQDIQTLQHVHYYICTCAIANANL